MTDLSNSREADSNASAADDGKRLGTREEQAGDAVKEQEYPYIAPPEIWARTPVTGPRG